MQIFGPLKIQQSKTILPYKVRKSLYLDQWFGVMIQIKRETALMFTLTTAYKINFKHVARKYRGKVLPGAGPKLLSPKENNLSLLKYMYVCTSFVLHLFL